MLARPLTCVLVGLTLLAACGEDSGDSYVSSGGQAAGGTGNTNASGTGALSSGGSDPGGNGNTGAVHNGGTGNTGAGNVGASGNAGGASNAGGLAGAGGSSNGDFAGLPIDDVEDGDYDVLAPRTGNWFTLADAGVTASLMPVSGGAEESTSAMEFSVTGFDVDTHWGAVAGLTLAGTPEAPGTEDASQSGGIAFWINVSAETFIQVHVFDDDSTLALSANRAGANHRANPKVPAGWSRVEVLWEEFSDAVELEPAALTGVEILMRSNDTYLLDEVQFLPVGYVPDRPDDSCQPACDGKSCGEDGCGGRCGLCAPGQICTAGTCAAGGNTPVGTHGQLTVSGTKIQDKNGSNVQLKGLSSFWLNGDPDRYATSLAGMRHLRDAWNVEVVRAAMGTDAREEGFAIDYFRAKAAFTEMMDTIIANALDLGLYVIIDWHAHRADQEVAEAREFFADMAQRYGSYPNVLYEIFNEPINQSWSTIRTYANQVIPEIRAHDANNLILVGSRFYSQNPQEAAGSPLSDPNVVYTLHFYSCTHGGDIRGNGQAALNAGLPLFVTEWGATHADGGSNGVVCQGGETDAWLNWMNTNQISWTAWRWQDCSDEASCILAPGSSVAGPYTNLTAHGTLIKNALE